LRVSTSRTSSTTTDARRQNWAAQKYGLCAGGGLGAVAPLGGRLRGHAAWSSSGRRVRLRNGCACSRGGSRILATESRSLPRCAHEAVVVRAELTSTHGVVVLAPVHESVPCHKLPLTAEAARGLEATPVSRPLTTTNGSARGGPRALPLCSGGRPTCYRVTGLADVRLDCKAPRRSWAHLGKAAETTQSCTGPPPDGSGRPRLAERGSDAHSASSCTTAPAGPWASLERLRHELHDALPVTRSPL